MNFFPDQPVFWREEPLSLNEAALLDALAAAHHASVFRGNASSQTVLNAAVGSGRYANGIAAACLTIGGVHAPLAESMAFISGSAPQHLVPAMLERGERVPGWGNSFVRGEPDADWSAVDGALRGEAAPLMAKVDAITRVLHRHGKTIFPNPSTFTAAVALTVRMPAAVAPFLFIASRLEGWSSLILNHLK